MAAFSQEDFLIPTPNLNRAMRPIPTVTAVISLPLEATIESVRIT